MFDIGFGELVVIAVLGLLILGPERLPVAIRTISLWIGRFKRSYRQIRTEIEKEVGADDIRRQLHNEEIMQSLQNTRHQLKGAVSDTKEELQSLQASVEDQPKKAAPAPSSPDSQPPTNS